MMSETSWERRKSHLNSKYNDLYVNIATHIGIIDIIDVCLKIHEIFVCNGFL